MKYKTNPLCRTVLLWICISQAILVMTKGTQVFGQDSARDVESWYGILDAGSRHFRFLIELEPKDGNWTGKLHSLDEGGQTFQLDGVIRDENVFEFKIRVSAAHFTGKLDDGKTVVEGSWKQRSADLPLKLEKVDQAPAEPLRATWRGKISALLQKLELQFRELEDGSVYFDSVTQKVGGFVATKSIDANTVTFAVPGVQGTFEGKLDDTGEKMVGKWKQGAVSLDLVLERLEQPTADAAPNRPQMPKAPFPYTVTEIKFENKHDGVILAGSLTVPEGGTDKLPAVILVSGSGPQDRDETLMGHKPFWVLADYFSRNGIAVLRYDDRGVGESTGSFETATSFEFASDAKAALEYLSQHPRIDTKKLGVCGHSEGGYIAAMIAAERPDLAFIIMMAGPGVPGELVLTSQMRLILEAGGFEKEQVENQCNSQRALIDLALKSPKLSEDEFIAQAKEVIARFQSVGETKEETLNAGARAAASQLRSPWFETFLVHDPAKDLERVSCPVMALVGEKDLQVDPKLNLPAIEQALRKSPSKDFVVLELPDLNHLFQKCKTGLMQEYAEIDETIDSGTLARMKDWILQHTR
jgi:pimeloyl-ACP methyl ester carboxylesterase